MNSFNLKKGNYIIIGTSWKKIKISSFNYYSEIIHMLWNHHSILTNADLGMVLFFQFDGLINIILNK